MTLDPVAFISPGSLGAAIETTVASIASPTELNSLGTAQGEIRLVRTTEAGTGNQTWYYLDTTTDVQALPYIVTSATAGLKWIAFGGRYNNGALSLAKLISIGDTTDSTKRLTFDLASLTTAKTLTIATGAQTLDRTLTVPVLSGNDTIVTLATATAFSSTVTVIDGNFSILGNVDATKKLTFQVDTQATASTLTIDVGAQSASRTLLVPVLAGTDTLMTLGVNQTVTGILTLGTPLASTSGGTGINNAGTITNASNTTITGGGTIALGGFTLTVPATGTAALLTVANTFTLVNTFSNATSATTSQTGAIVQNSGAAATSVGIGQGNINAGTLLRSAGTAPATAVDTGSIQTTGGYSAWRASFLRGVSSSGDVNALQTNYFSNQSVDPAAFRSCFTGINSTSGAGAGNTSFTVGAQFTVLHATAALTLADTAGFYSATQTTIAGAVMTRAYGYYNANSAETGTVGTKYAFYTQALTGATTHYAFFSAGVGLVSIGDTTDSTSPTTGSVTTLGGISWGVTKSAFGGGFKSTSPTLGIGYATGAGGAVTQITSRVTGVTTNTICGAITLVSAAGLATYQTFTVTNSAVAATDVVRVSQKSGTDKYIIHVTATTAGTFDITFATTGGVTAEQPVFNFAIIKAVAA